jgi:hypothetical protein
MSVNTPNIGTINRSLNKGVSSRNKIGGNKTLGGTTAHIVDVTQAEESDSNLTGVLTVCYLLARDSLVLAQSDTTDYASYLSMVECGKDAARGVKELMTSAVVDYLETGFRGRLGEVGVEVDEGFVVLNN